MIVATAVMEVATTRQGVKETEAAAAAVVMGAMTVAPTSVMREMVAATEIRQAEKAVVKIGQTERVEVMAMAAVEAREAAAEMATRVAEEEEAKEETSRGRRLLSRRWAASNNQKLHWTVPCMPSRRLPMSCVTLHRDLIKPVNPKRKWTRK